METCHRFSCDIFVAFSNWLFDLQGGSIIFFQKFLCIKFLRWKVSMFFLHFTFQIFSFKIRLSWICFDSALDKKCSFFSGYHVSKMNLLMTENILHHYLESKKLFFLFASLVPLILAFYLSYGDGFSIRLNSFQTICFNETPNSFL